MSTEVILLIVIAGVLVLDFILNGRKKSSVDETIDRIEGAKPVKSKNFLDYIIKRKRNIVLFILSVFISKILIHFFIYTSKLNNGEDRGEYIGGINYTNFREWDAPLSYHINNVFFEKVWLFIPTIILLSFFIWYFNDKIKAR